MIIKDIRSMEKLLIGVGTFTNTINSFDTQGLKFVTMNELNELCPLFLSFFSFFPLNDSPSNYEKCFLCHLKSSCRCQDTPVFVVFFSSLSQFPDSKGQMEVE